MVLANTAAHMRMHRQDPKNVGPALSAGVLAVNNALAYFTAVPPQETEGFTVFGDGLLATVLAMVPQDTQKLQDFATFMDAWQTAITTLPSVVDGISSGLANYRQDGNVASMMRVFLLAITELATLVTQYLPEDIALEVANYLGALEDVLDGFDDAMEAFEEGDTVAAAQTIFSALRVATDELVPMRLQTDVTYAAVMRTLDGVMQNLSTTVLEYQQKLLTSSVCWKVFERRQRVRPSECPKKHFFDGEHWCFQEHEDFENAALLEISMGKKRPNGAIPSRCDQRSDFGERRGAWCYGKCPSGKEKA